MTSLVVPVYSEFYISRDMKTAADKKMLHFTAISNTALTDMEMWDNFFKYPTSTLSFVIIIISRYAI